MSGINPIDQKLGFPCPLTLTCTVTGDQVVYSDPNYIKERIEKAGNLETLLKTYVSKAGKRVKREQSGIVAKPKPDVRPGRMWGGKPILAEDNPIADIRVNAPATGRARTTHFYLCNDHGRDWVSTVNDYKSHPEQKDVIVHDFRKDKTVPFDSNRLFPETVKAIREAGIVLTK